MSQLIFDIEKLLEPYKNGGTEAQPVQRTIGTIATKLLYSYKFGPDIVGKAIFETFWEIANKGLEFKGDGSWDSNGTELFTHIRNRCAEMAKDSAVKGLVENILGELSCVIKDCPKRSRTLQKTTKWQRLWKALNKPRGFWRL